MISIKIAHTLARRSREDLTIDVEQAFCTNKTISGIFGDSGTGKSALLKCMAGLQPQASYSLHFKQQRFESLPAHLNPCVYVGADAVLFEHLSVEKNLQLIMHKASFSTQQFVSLNEAITSCGIEHLLHQSPKSLSSGEKQRVQFARALLSNKPIVLLDEAFSALDWTSRMGMIAQVNRLNASTGLHFIMVSHSLKELSHCCEQIIKLQQGKVERVGTVDDILLYLANELHSQLVFSNLRVEFVAYDASDNISQWQLAATPTQAAQYVYVNQLNSNAGHQQDDMLLNIDANKVSLSCHSNHQSSMLNSLQGTVCDINLHEYDALICLNVNEQFIRASISLRSLHALNISLGMSLFAHFKAV